MLTIEKRAIAEEVEEKLNDACKKALLEFFGHFFKEQEDPPPSTARQGDEPNIDT